MLLRNWIVYHSRIEPNRYRKKYQNIWFQPNCELWNVWSTHNASINLRIHLNWNNTIKTGRMSGWNVSKGFFFHGHSLLKEWKLRRQKMGDFHGKKWSYYIVSRAARHTFIRTRQPSDMKSGCDMKTKRLEKGNQGGAEMQRGNA